MLGRPFGTSQRRRPCSPCDILFNTPSGTPPNTAAYTGPTLAQYLQGTFSNADLAYKFDPANPVGTTSAASGTASINLTK